jgi:hypothetical protein
MMQLNSQFYWVSQLQLNPSCIATDISVRPLYFAVKGTENGEQATKNVLTIVATAIFAI